ncbi:hypothetical protein SUDANB108_00005 [Streptomyces sp. enrichment culture]|uniref:CAP domain-containing protein n=1 Tax=Streptomyces sp. enrichment culture TaxID=1795815 RepID=UPI003F57A09F
MRHGVTLLACLALAALPATAGAAPATPTPQTSATHLKTSPDIDGIVCEINKERAINGLPALGIAPQANDVANLHARDMARMGKLTPIGSDGRNLRDRLTHAHIYSSIAQEFMHYGYTESRYFADMATDSTAPNDLYRALMQDIVALGMGYSYRYTDVILLGHHRKLRQRHAVCM